MKKKLNLLLLFIFIIPLAYGQVRFGPRIGYSKSSFNPDYYTAESHYRGSLDVGIFAKISLAKKFNLQTELMYNGKGYGDYEYDDNSGIGMWTNVRNRYVDVPILASVGNNFCLLVGVVPSFILKSETEVEFSYGYPNYDYETETLDTKDDFNPFDFGICLGFEHEFKFGLNYGVRVNYGILNIDNTDGTEYKNFSILTSIGYSLGSR